MTKTKTVSMMTYKERREAYRTYGSRVSLESEGDFIRFRRNGSGFRTWVAQQLFSNGWWPIAG